MSDLTSVASSLLYVLGYTFFCLGVTTQKWRSEIGYCYGVWLRCDEVECTSLLVDITGYLFLVQCGIAGAFLFLTVSAVGVVVCDVTKLCKANQRHVRRTNQVICITATTGELLAAASLFLYGYKTVLARERYPALLWGFAVTGLGVALSLLGNIVRIMGPVSSWDNGLSCLLPRRAHPHHMMVYSDGSGTYSGDSSESQHGSERLISSKSRHRKCRTKSGTRREGQKGCGCTSAQSSDCGTSEINYRHYEDVSFDDMPPPPFELLHPPTQDFSHIVISRNAHRDHTHLGPGSCYGLQPGHGPRDHIQPGPGPSYGFQSNIGPSYSLQPGLGPRDYTQAPHSAFQAHLTHQAAELKAYSNPSHYLQFQTIPPPPPPPPPPPLPPQTITSYRHKDPSASALSRTVKPTPKARLHQARNHNASTLPSSYVNATSPSNQNASRARPRQHAEVVKKTRTLPSRTHDNHLQ